MPGKGKVTCHSSPTICGLGDVRSVQFPAVKFVFDCRVKPDEAAGHESVRFVTVIAMFNGGGASASGVTLAWTELVLSPARFSAETT